MRIARIATSGGRVVFARLEGGGHRGQARVLSAAPWEGGLVGGETVDWRSSDLRVPVVPTKIVAVGRNYRAHAKELGNDVPTTPLLFLKPPSALLDPNGSIVRPKQSQRVEHEAELGVVIGRRCKNVSADEALAHVFGYTVLCDVTARDLQKSDVQFTRAKGFDTFCPVGPWIETDVDPHALSVVARVNGETKQSGNTRDMVFSVEQLVAFMSSVMTLEAGDVIATGTPEGVGPLVAKDVLEVEIERIGVLRCEVRDARED
jgi:2-keto-4-pentenoate hydratase/2-oxohepta-3-ene-1,7-dioic acid hydratase in catechol pathway